MPIVKADRTRLRTVAADAMLDLTPDPAPLPGAELQRSALEVFDIPIELLVDSDENCNEQDDKTFDQLVEGIREDGFDEPIQVVPHPDGKRYVIASGHHRKKAAQLLKHAAVPCVVKAGWDEDKRKIELVRRNMLRGKLNPEKFTALFNELTGKYDRALLQTMMGFTQKDAFEKVYRNVAASLPERQKKQLDEAKETIRSVDDLSSVLNRIFKEGGSELEHGFLVFSFGGKDHVYVQADKELEARVKKLIGEAKSAGLKVGDAFKRVLANVDLTAGRGNGTPVASRLRRPGLRKPGE